MTDHERRAKEFGFIFQEFQPLLQVGLDYSFYHGETVWRMSSGET